MSVVSSLRKRIRETRAFTLAEALVATIIVLLVTAIVAAGIPAAFNAYNNVVVASNAEVLLSNSMTALRNELGMARDVTIEGNTITYYNPMYDSFSKITVGGYDIMYRRFAPDGVVVSGTTGNGSEEVKFASLVASDKDYGLHVKCTSADYSNGVITFTGLAVGRDGNLPTGVTPINYKIRVITYGKE